MHATALPMTHNGQPTSHHVLYLISFCDSYHAWWSNNNRHAYILLFPGGLLPCLSLTPIESPVFTLVLSPQPRHDPDFHCFVQLSTFQQQPETTASRGMVYRVIDSRLKCIAWAWFVWPKPARADKRESFILRSSKVQHYSMLGGDLYRSGVPIS